MSGEASMSTSASLKLPLSSFSPWASPVDGAALLDEILFEILATGKVTSENEAVALTLTYVNQFCDGRLGLRQSVGSVETRLGAVRKSHVMPRKALRWAIDHLDQLICSPSNACFYEVDDGRAAFIVIADVVGGRWPRLARTACSDSRLQEVYAHSARCQMGSFAMVHCEGLSDPVWSASEIAQSLNFDEASIWRYLGPAGISTARVRRLLRGVGINSRSLQEGHRKGYRLKEMLDVLCPMYSMFCGYEWKLDSGRICQIGYWVAAPFPSPTQ